MAPPISQHESVVDNILSRLPSDEAAKISKELFQSTVEGLRLLAIKARIGTLGGRRDMIETRAAALIHYFLRVKTSNNIPIAKLAATCGMKGKDLEDLTRKVENYMATTTVATSTPRRSTHTTSSSTVKKNGESKKKKEEDSTILTISVRLGSEIPNSSWFAQKAQQLFIDMKKQVRRTANVHQRNDYLQDIQRNQIIYEAACFYFLVEKEVSKEQDVLNIMLDAAKVSKTEFLDVYPTARKFFDLTEKVQQIKAKRELEKQQSVGDQRDSKKILKKSKTSLSAEEICMDNGNRMIDESSQVVPPKKFHYSKRFQEWKSNILENSIQEAKEECNLEEISRPEALKIAADKVVTYYVSKS